MSPPLSMSLSPGSRGNASTLPGARERGVPKRGGGMRGLWSDPCLLPYRWREAGGGDGSRAAAGGSPGTAQESRGFQREPRGRSHGNGWDGALEVSLGTESSRFCPAEGIQGFQGYIRTSDSAQQPSQWINPLMSHWNWVDIPPNIPHCSMCPVSASLRGAQLHLLCNSCFSGQSHLLLSSALSWTGEPLYPRWSLQAGGTWNCSHGDTCCPLSSRSPSPC